ncbi:alpha/beta hydrolase [Bacillus songklensis]|uniref:Alpha/beta hydrolase n=1 Tax=Bacillus songklensis TaxID=1069116 RepID=A0ABV8B676_9BACI
MEEKYPVLEKAKPFYYEGSDIGVLVVHGFTGTTQSMHGLGKRFADAGYTVCGPRLKGHGTHQEDMEQSTYKEWIQSAEEGYQWLKERCEQIFVAGLSMGGTLTLHLASVHKDIKGIMPINAAIDIPSMKEGEQLKDVRFLDAIGSDIKAQGVVELAYEKTPVKSIFEINQFMKETKEAVSSILCPALIFVSTIDHVVPPENSQYIYEKLASNDKQLVELKNSYHVATLDHDKEFIADKCIEFIKRLC